LVMGAANRGGAKRQMVSVRIVKLRRRYIRSVLIVEGMAIS